MDSRTTWPHGRRAAGALVLVLTAGLLGGCGGDDPYCDAVEKNKTTLDSFGQKLSDAAFARYAQALQSITAVAPKAIEPDWDRLTKVTQNIVTVHEDVGFPLQDMDDADKRSSLSAGDIDRINRAYRFFNRTQDERKAVVADVDEQCDISLDTEK